MGGQAVSFEAEEENFLLVPACSLATCRPNHRNPGIQASSIVDSLLKVVSAYPAAILTQSSEIRVSVMPADSFTRAILR